jgi:hypothetical protein
MISRASIQLWVRRNTHAINVSGFPRLLPECLAEMSGCQLVAQISSHATLHCRNDGEECSSRPIPECSYHVRSRKNGENTLWALGQDLSSTGGNADAPELRPRCYRSRHEVSKRLMSWMSAWASTGCDFQLQSRPGIDFRPLSTATVIDHGGLLEIDKGVVIYA